MPDPRNKKVSRDTVRITKPTYFKLKENDYIGDEDFENQFEQIEGDASTFPQFSVQDYSRLKKDKKGFYVTKLKEGENNDSGINMGSPLYAKISSACKAAAKRKFKVWPSAYASGWGVRCTKAGGPSKFGGGKKK